MSWTGTEPGIEAVKKGHAVVMTPASYVYLDMAQAPGERGHSWVGLINTEKVYSYRPLDSEVPADKLKNILGVQSNLWSEYLDRPPGQANFQTYPRLCALAEVGWTDDGLRKWEEFNDRLGQKHLPRLAQLGIRFRIPMPKAIDDKGKVTVSPPYEDAEVRYTTDGSDPVKSSSRWEPGTQVKDVKKLRTRTFVGDLGSRTRVGADRLAAANWIPKMVSEEFKDVEFDVTEAMHTRSRSKKLNCLKTPRSLQLTNTKVQREANT
jgi:hexosaminidase